jgi:hypothetical protein
MGNETCRTLGPRHRHPACQIRPTQFRWRSHSSRAKDSTLTSNCSPSRFSAVDFSNGSLLGMYHLARCSSRLRMRRELPAWFLPTSVPHDPDVSASICDIVRCAPTTFHPSPTLLLRLEKNLPCPFARAGATNGQFHGPPQRSETQRIRQVVDGRVLKLCHRFDAL